MMIKARSFANLVIKNIENLNPAVVLISDEQSVLVVDTKLRGVVELPFFPTHPKLPALKATITTNQSQSATILVGQVKKPVAVDCQAGRKVHMFLKVTAQQPK